MLRLLAFQSLVVNSFPVDQFLPGKGYAENARNLRLLTRDCVGRYKIVKQEEFVVNSAGQEDSEELENQDRFQLAVVQATVN